MPVMPTVTELRRSMVLPGPRSEREVAVAEYAARATRDYVVGVLVEATDAALAHRRYGDAIRGAAELGHILGLYQPDDISDAAQVLDALRTMAQGSMKGELGEPMIEDKREPPPTVTYSITPPDPDPTPTG